MAAIQDLCRLFPHEMALWLEGRAGHKTPLQIEEVSFIEPGRKGPAYVVPAAAEAPAQSPPPSPEALIKQLLLTDLEHEGQKSKAHVQVVRVDWAEQERQTLAKGGAEVELLVRATRPGKKATQGPFTMLLGVPIIGEGDDGTETHWKVLETISWHLVAHLRLVPASDRDEGPITDTVVLYLWPGTGLKDRQEDCSVVTMKMPGLLGTLIEGARDRERDRKANRERLRYHRKLDRERRAAAARRRERTGDAGISEDELAALIPAIDVDNDRITMRSCYPTVLLWDEPVDKLLKELPSECIGLAFFGYRPAGVSDTDVLTQCAWVLRRQLRDADAAHVTRVILGLTRLAEVFLSPAEIDQVMTAMKLG